MDTFDLPCRLVEFFDEGQAVAMWIEDGSKFPLYTCSDIKPYDSLNNQAISKDCTCICVRGSKKLFNLLELERQMLLYLRGVKLAFQISRASASVSVALFDVQGAVEQLPLSNTNYAKPLLERLQKSKIGKEVKPIESTGNFYKISLL